MPRTLLLDTASARHAPDVAGVARLAERLGDVAVVTSAGDTADRVAEQITAYCRQHPDVEHVIVLPATTVLPGWTRAARQRYRELPRRPRTVFALAGSDRATARRVLVGRLTGTLHRAVTIDGSDHRGVVRADRPDGAAPAHDDVYAATVIGVPPYYTSLLGPLRHLGTRLRDRLRREVTRRLARPRPHGDLVRLGSDLCGWWVPAGAARPGTVAYCAGAGEDISFDLVLHERGCVVRTLDPTPRAIAHVERVAPDDDRFRFLPVGLWDQPDELRFYAPAGGTGVSHSAVNLGGTDEYFTATVRPLPEIVAEVGDDHVDLLKLDIEGAEYRVIDSLLASRLRPSTLCIEFDQPVPVRSVLGAVRRLGRAGYDLVRVETWNYTFALR